MTATVFPWVVAYLVVGAGTALVGSIPHRTGRVKPVPWWYWVVVFVAWPVAVVALAIFLVRYFAKGA